MTSNKDGQLRLAVFIDGDNTSYRLADKLFAEIAKFGSASIRKFYGDFSSAAAQGWKDAVQKHAIVSHQQFANAAGKNATDISLVVDAMDVLHRGGIDAFCIVSSDSDYTRLATRIREHGLLVLGFGKAKAALNFRQACHEFVVVENLEATSTQAPVESDVVPSPPKASKAVPLAQATRLLLRAALRLQGPAWVPLTKLLAEVRTLQPGFTVKAYGYSKPITLVRKTECFDAELRNGTMMVRTRSTVATMVARAA